MCMTAKRPSGTTLRNQGLKITPVVTGFDCKLPKFPLVLKSTHSDQLEREKSNSGSAHIPSK
jgi:hypothetical protein